MLFFTNPIFMKKQERSAHFAFLFWLLVLSTSATFAQEDNYCIPHVASQNLYISDFKFITISNPSGNNGYTFYPTYTTVEPGQNYFYSLTFPGGSGPKFYALYIDFDGNGDFMGGSELLVNMGTSSDYAAEM